MFKSGCVTNNLWGQTIHLAHIGLSTHSEDFRDKFHLTYTVPLGDSVYLPFADHIHGLITSQSASRRGEGFEFFACFRQPFNCSVVFSTILFKYFFCRNLVVSGNVLSAINVFIAFGYAAFLSTVTTRGVWVGVAFNILRKKCSAEERVSLRTQ